MLIKNRMEWKTISDKDGKDIISKDYADQVEYGFASNDGLYYPIERPLKRHERK